jgi:tRNA-specific 2-thiouridylase
MQLWGKDVCVSSGTRLCCSVRDALDARAVARRLGIPHETLELADTFRSRVIDYFVGSYRRGLTPNPCIACNDHIKFGALLEHAKRRSAGLVATGHYARTAFDEVAGRYTLARALDARKDQSYVLFNLSQAQLSKVRFPLGGMRKTEVRALAQRLGLATAEKPDSQDVCFVRDGNKDGFLRRELGTGDARGPITDTDGHRLGTHRGLLGYTIGQREGLGIAVGRPMYVVALDQPNDRLVVGPQEALLDRMLTAERVNWLSIPPPERPIRALVKIRSRHEGGMATVTPHPDHGARVEFDAGQLAITPGQAAVFYDEELVLGGGWIAAHE